MVGYVMFSTKAEAFLLKFKTISLLIYVLAMCSSQASYNVTILLFVNSSRDQCFHEELDGMLRQDIIPLKSEVMDFRLLKANVTSTDRSHAGVLEVLSFIETHSATVDGAIFVDITREQIVFSSLLRELNILTVGLFQDENIIHTQESSVEFTRVTFPSVYHYATSAWKIIKKHRWRTICLILSASYEGNKVAEQMSMFAFQEKWEIQKIVWLMPNDMTGNETMAELKGVLARNSDVIIMHSCLGDEERLFKSIEELGVRKYKTVWIVTDITTHLIDPRNLPEGLLKISLRRPEQCHDNSIYGNALQDAMLLFQLSFEESVKECYKDSDVTSCEKGNNSQKIRRIARRRMAQKSLSGKSLLFDINNNANNKYSTFTIWNLKGDGFGVKNWFPVGMGASIDVAMETYTSPNGKSISPVSHPRRPVVHVAVNEYPPFVYKVNTIGEEGCVGRFVPCYAHVNTSNALEEKKFCCCGVSLDFLAFLQRDLNFEAHVYFNPDGQFGIFNANTGAWNGIVGELVDGKAMLTLELGLNRRRERVISFAHPTLLLELGILVKKADMRTVVGDSWLHPFSTSLWLTLLGTSCAVIIVIWWLDRKSPQGHYHMLEGSGRDGFTLLDSISYVGGVLFGKDIGPERTPLSTSSRLVAYVYSLLALIMINTYCANLMAFLLEENVSLPIIGIDDPKLISEPPLFKAAAVRGSYEEDYFKNHINSSFQKIYEVNLRENSVPNLETGVEHMRQGKIQGLIGDYLSLSQIANKNCSFKLLKGTALKSGTAFAVPKTSPWLQEISLSVLTHQENGTVKSIMNRWFAKSVCNGNEHRRLDLSDFVGLFGTVIAVSGFSLLALFAEMLILFALIKFGTSLGPLGRFLKRFLFNVKRGEEDQTVVENQVGLMTTRCDVTERQISFDSNGSVDIRELERKIASSR